MNPELIRQQENDSKKVYWHKWGPYLSERQWGTVREDYSENGDAWSYFPFDEAHARAYRWGEDGIGGISDSHQKLCFALALWNGKDPILKERLFGLSNPEGNHGEDVKECYYYLDNTPTHSYMKYLYKYPQAEFPYQWLRDENRKRTQQEREFELIDTGIFNDNKYFDIFIEYAKADFNDIYIYITLFNRGSEKARCHVLPTIWYRNTWVWSGEHSVPRLDHADHQGDGTAILCQHPFLGNYVLYGEKADEALFTDNETNMKKVFGKENRAAHLKDAFHEYVIKGNKSAVNPCMTGTKAALHYICDIEPQGSRKIKLRLTQKRQETQALAQADQVYTLRNNEANQFFNEFICNKLCDDERHVERLALSGFMWNKQYYHYAVERWLEGEPLLDGPHFTRKNSRNKDWVHVYTDDILSMPDKWEYPWFAAWDLAFHAFGIARLDFEFAKRQLKVITREWFMHPNGQLPAYEWNFNDINPPVHAWAVWRIYKMEQKYKGKGDIVFLEAVFQKLLLTFTWWVNRQDESGRNIFKGGFLGLDNISVFNRSSDLGPDVTLYQSDATSWMGMFAITMLTIAVELSKTDASYEDLVSKFTTHFLYISRAINYDEGTQPPLWNKDEGFYYDLLMFKGGGYEPLKIRSLVGLIPLLSVGTVEAEDLQRMKGFSKRFQWFLDHRPDLCSRIASAICPGVNGRRLLSIVNEDKLRRILKIMLDENEFLSAYGIRSISKSHEKHPFVMDYQGQHLSIGYEPRESKTRNFGGNSNWRGPIWMPINLLLIESLQKYYHYYGDDFKIECPTGSGKFMTLWEVSQELAKRLTSIFAKNAEGKRVVFGENSKLQTDPYFKDYPLFHEYFDGDTGEGLGASQQTGWTGVIAKIMHQVGVYKDTHA